MKKFYNLTLLVLLVPVMSFAQSNYKPGYVVNLKGDTIKGYVDYQEWDANPDVVSFKKTSAEQSVKYGTSDISAFGIDKLEAFTRYSGRISTNQVDPNYVVTDAESEADTSFRVAAVFLKVLEKGSRIALYSYKDNLKIRFYVGEAPDYTPKELIYRLTRTHTEKTYQKQLSAAAAKSNELNDNFITIIAHSEYTEDNLLDIANRINRISKAEYNKSHYSGSSVNFFAGAGLTILSTTPDPGQAYYAGGGRSYTSLGPAVSLGLNLFANPATKRLQFRIELSGALNSYKSLYTLKVSPYKPTEMSYDVQALSASPQVIYNFYNTDNLKLFLGFGIVFSHYNYSNAYFGTQNHDGSEGGIADNNPFVFNTSDNSFIGKLGAQFGSHFLIYGAIQSKVSATLPDYYALTATYSQVGINYLF